MFTGLIADLGTVGSLELGDGGATLSVGTALAGELRDGDSIAVNGVCLTATEVGADRFTAEAMIETLERSSLGALEPGTRVNLELPLRAEDRLGGHVVQGHVDGTGVVAATREEGFSRVLEIDADAGLTRYLVEKGSVALDGVSLTVSALDGDRFAVSLIPETLQRTNLGSAAPGTRLNIEVDILAKHLERLMEARA
ncbi:MAG TPA: riboflavin synthase [Solirubrobacteraceae bacterium]|nr:riboflavin synthase [Solirubrobacteraceae bacterium]